MHYFFNKIHRNFCCVALRKVLHWSFRASARGSKTSVIDFCSRALSEEEERRCFHGPECGYSAPPYWQVSRLSRFWSGPIPAMLSRRVATGLNQPTQVVQAPNDSTDLYIVQRLQRVGSTTTSGGILKYNPITKSSSTFLDLSSGLANVQDGGILSMAFSPNYASNGLFYVASLVGSGSTTCRVDEYQVNGGIVSLDRNLLTYTNLAPTHSVDWIGFQPGGNPNQLFITTGDGGIEANIGTFQNFSQNLNSLYGKVLRIDVSGGDAYPADPNKNFAIPSDNPFASTAGALPEIYASGLRNPFRASFDRSSGDLYIGDVGFNHEEEIDFLKAGNNAGPDYGWAKREGHDSDA